MSWFKQMLGSDPIAEVSGQDATGINDAIYDTSDAILSAKETRTPPVPDVPGPARTDETKRRQLALLESYVAKVSIR